MDDLIISVFYEIDNFCKEFIPYMEQQCIQTGDKPHMHQLNYASIISRFLI